MNTPEDSFDADDLIKDGSDASFMADVIEASKSVPVIVDFWAPWCGPCRQLGPALEKVVRKASGKVRMVKINVDENPGVSGQLQVRSIPAVFAFKDEKPLDGFSGALPESQLQAFVDKLTGDMDIEKEVLELIDRANESLKLGDMGGAAQDFAGALSLNDKSPQALAGMARVYLANEDFDAAKGVLALVAEEDLADPTVIGAQKALDMAEKAPSDDEFEPLLTAVQSQPNDLNARFALAEALLGKGRIAEASEELFIILETELNWNDQAARKMLLNLFEVAGATSEVTTSGRRRLSSLLFR